MRNHYEKEKRATAVIKLQKVWAGEGCKVLTPCFRNGVTGPREGAEGLHSLSQGWLSTPGVLVTALFPSPARMLLTRREESAQSKASSLLQNSILFSFISSLSSLLFSCLFPLHPGWKSLAPGQPLLPRMRIFEDLCLALGEEEGPQLGYPASSPSPSRGP